MQHDIITNFLSYQVQRCNGLAPSITKSLDGLQLSNHGLRNGADVKAKFFLDIIQESHFSPELSLLGGGWFSEGIVRDRTTTCMRGRLEVHERSTGVVG